MKYYYVRKYESGEIIFKKEIPKEEFDLDFWEEGNLSSDGLPEKATIDCHIWEEEE